MVYDERLVGRIRAMLAGRPDLREKNMFGGVSFLLNGKMCFGVIKDDLVVRVGPKIYEKALAMPHARPMDFTGKPMKGFVYVGSKGLSRNAALEKWLGMGMNYASSLLEK
ncbi:MAG: TfoX/Sxy family protein [Nitrososphaera sp.]|uniref:TfoX/Sxy family protein n=1 Tax=Nitrososphaera sp. TaxID=1971748 RepID=UPI003D6F09BE